MRLERFVGVNFALLVALFCEQLACYEETCNRRPLGTNTLPLPPDNTFMLDIEGIDDMYMPGQEYKVTLSSRDQVSTFIAFSIFIREDTKPNEKNSRKPIPLNPGVISAHKDDNNSEISKICNHTVIQTNITPKTSVAVTWRAPPKDNKCVWIYAYVAVKPDVWYSNENPLSKRVCEDRRKADDMQPNRNDNCQVCEDARYQLTFEGLWSYNTHPHSFPKIKGDEARFSDVVGASHNTNYNLYKFNTDASKGLKMLAEQGNTTELEIEIQTQLGVAVRTVIKANGQPKPNMSTTASFRASKEHHLVSLVAAIIPSPDWFLGVANLELCEQSSNQWAEKVSLNLYPMDAGTDSGETFDSANEETSPPRPISSAIIAKDIPKEELKAFARLQFDLIRTYSTDYCNTVRLTPVTTEETTTTSPIVSSEETVTADPNSNPDCPMTPWEDLPCECVYDDDTVVGLQTKVRYHIVDGVAVGKYVENGADNADKTVQQYCLDKYPDTSVIEFCTDKCTVT